MSKRRSSLKGVQSHKNHLVKGKKPRKDPGLFCPKGVTFGFCARIFRMKRTYIKDIPANVGKEIIIKGWVDVRRDMGKLIFLDLRDMTGRVQAVALPNHKEVGAVASQVRPEWVVDVRGKVNERPPKTVNKNDANGAVELEILEIKVLNSAETPPIDIRGDGVDFNEELRSNTATWICVAPECRKISAIATRSSLFSVNICIGTTSSRSRLLF